MGKRDKNQSSIYPTKFEPFSFFDSVGVEHKYIPYMLKVYFWKEYIWYIILSKLWHKWL